MNAHDSRFKALKALISRAVEVSTSQKLGDTCDAQIREFCLTLDGRGAETENATRRTRARTRAASAGSSVTEQSE